jgi:hypothetical protein
VESEGRQIETVVNKVQKIQQQKIPLKNIAAGAEIQLSIVRRRPGQNRVTWKTPSSRAFVPLQEPVVVLASYVPYTQMPV